MINLCQVDEQMYFIYVFNTFPRQDIPKRMEKIVKT